jgi:[ribosomal protein S18]-alanine N-acetyltransferase
MQIFNLDYSLINSLIVFMEKNKGDLQFFNPHKFDEESIRKIIKSKKKDEYFVVIKNSQIISYLMLRGWDDGYDIPSLGIIIDKKYRGNGLSKLFMNYLECVSRLNGAKEIRLTVYKNNDKAVKLYEKMGYKLENFNENSYIGIKTL